MSANIVHEGDLVPLKAHYKSPHSARTQESLYQGIYAQRTLHRSMPRCCPDSNGKVCQMCACIAINTGFASRSAMFHYLWCLHTIQLQLPCQGKSDSCNPVQQKCAHWRIACIADCLFQMPHKKMKSRSCRKGSNQFSLHSLIWDLKSSSNWASSQNFLWLNFGDIVRKTQIWRWPPAFNALSF